MERLVVIVHSIIMQNEENGFVIFKGNDFLTKKEVSVKGYSLNISEGDILDCTGIWKNNKPYGWQMNSNEIKIYTPITTKEIKKYLESGYIRGISSNFAKRIVDSFGEETIKIIDKEPERLREISGIGEKTLSRIIKDWENKRLNQRKTDELSELGFSFDESIKIIRCLGEDAIKIIFKNPYIVMRIDDLNINFDKIDDIAIKKLRKELDNETRILSYLIFYLNENESNGNTYIEKDFLTIKSVKKLKVEKDLIDLIIEVGCLKNIFSICSKDSLDIIQNYATYKAEFDLSIKINKLKNSVKKVFNNINSKIELFESEKFKLSDGQRTAVIDCFENNVNIINGGPGVGKTTVLSILTQILKLESKTFKMCAFTGRASQKMKESTGFDASTIHRLLEYNPAFNEFKRNSTNPIEADFIIIDEASMIDLFLFIKLFDAIDIKTSVIIIGDSNQIQSVSCGAVLRDLISSKKVNLSSITKLQRQAENSNIAKNSYLVNEGNFIEEYNKDGGDFYFIKTSSDFNTMERIKEILNGKLQKAFNLNPKTDLQILTPIHEGILGRKNINLSIQSILNPKKNSDVILKRPDLEFRLKDNVAQVRNDYEKNVMNGDTGFIENISKECITVSYPDYRVKYKKNELYDLELAYAITMHKSQGSEYPAVIIPISELENRTINRSLLYTAITRGKKVVILIGSISQLKNIIKRNIANERKTNLKNILIENIV